MFFISQSHRSDTGLKGKVNVLANGFFLRYKEKNVCFFYHQDSRLSLIFKVNCALSLFCKRDLAYAECIQLLSCACFCCFSTLFSMALQIFRYWDIVMLYWFYVINSFKYCIFHMIYYCELLARTFKSKFLMFDYHCC